MSDSTVDDRTPLTLSGIKASIQHIEETAARARELEKSVGSDSSQQDVDSVFDELGKCLDAVSDECKEILRSPECDHHVVKDLDTIYVKYRKYAVGDTIDAEICPARRMVECPNGALYDEDERIESIITLCERVDNYYRGDDVPAPTDPAELFDNGIDVAVDRITAAYGVSEPLVSRTGELSIVFVDACKTAIEHHVPADAIRQIVVITEVLRKHPSITVSPTQNMTLASLIIQLLEVVNLIDTVNSWLLLKFTAGIEPVFTEAFNDVRYAVYESIVDYARYEWGKAMRSEMEYPTCMHDSYADNILRRVRMAASSYDEPHVSNRSLTDFVSVYFLDGVILYAQLLRDNPLPRRLIDLVREVSRSDVTYQTCITE